MAGCVCCERVGSGGAFVLSTPVRGRQGGDRVRCALAGCVEEVE